jgi:signal transduction histidine kinase
VSGLQLFESTNGSATTAAARRDGHVPNDAEGRQDLVLATFAHEMRNPLAALRNALHLWPLVCSDQAEMEELRHLMQRQVEQMSRLREDLLDVWRIAQEPSFFRLIRLMRTWSRGWRRF